jgi:hypothetical protein
MAKIRSKHVFLPPERGIVPEMGILAGMAGEGAWFFGDAV